jgi:hypothetical protein
MRREHACEFYAGAWVRACGLCECARAMCARVQAFHCLVNARVLVTSCCGQLRAGGVLCVLPMRACVVCVIRGCPTQTTFFKKTSRVLAPPNPHSYRAKRGIGKQIHR